MRIQPHRRLSFAYPKPRQRSRVPYDRHPLPFDSPLPAPKVPPISFDRRRDGRDLRIRRHNARRERRTLVERSQRVQIPETPDPEERRAERDAHAPRAAFLLSGQSVSGVTREREDTHGHGLAERGGDAEREQVPRGVVQDLHRQRAVRRQLGGLFLARHLADIIRVRLPLLHIESSKSLNERIELTHHKKIHPVSFSRGKNRIESGR